MQKYAVKCTCGDEMSVEAASLEEGKTKLTQMMTAEATAAHFREKHPGQAAPPMDQVQAMVQTTTYLVA